MSNLVIGIEGLVGAGKTSICRELIKKMPNTVLVNGGNLYRAIIYTLMNNTVVDLNELKNNAQNIDIKEKIIIDFQCIKIKIIWQICMGINAPDVTLICGTRLTFIITANP